MTRNEVVGSETLTISTTAVALTPANYASPVTKVFLYVEGAIRYWRSGKLPTSTQGILTTSGTTISLDIAEATGLRMIRQGGADVPVHVEYIKEVQS